MTPAFLAAHRGDFVVPVYLHRDDRAFVGGVDLGAGASLWPSDLTREEWGRMLKEYGDQPLPFADLLPDWLKDHGQTMNTLIDYLSGRAAKLWLDLRPSAKRQAVEDAIATAKNLAAMKAAITTTRNTLSGAPVIYGYDKAKWPEALRKAQIGLVPAVVRYEQSAAFFYGQSCPIDASTGKPVLCAEGAQVVESIGALRNRCAIGSYPGGMADGAVLGTSLGGYLPLVGLLAAGIFVTWGLLVVARILREKTEGDLKIIEAHKEASSVALRAGMQAQEACLKLPAAERQACYDSAKVLVTAATSNLPAPPGGGGGGGGSGDLTDKVLKAAVPVALALGLGALALNFVQGKMARRAAA